MFSDSYRSGWTKRQRVIQVLGGVCQGCGFADSRALQVTPAGTGNSYYGRILRDPSGYELFCANCNQIKRAPDIPKSWKDRLAQRAVLEKIVLTEKQKRLVRSAIGLKDGIKISQRNRAVVGTEDNGWGEWMELVNRGLAHRKPAVDDEDDVFWVPRTTAAAALNLDEQLANDFRWAQPNL